ncbi:hypothetical protein AJ85_10475 [Alkalihalobacillus alcalophilus ATCC 27647 = CGMCC 1.3604]|uniref:Multi-TM2 domain-containing protein n=1 Tax=Alkalihalobacillus alcalophilus ATCC 27647 = CGMCC 1.3604 TaxID=1218173 RepID=A0A094WGB2_ALKAL|nr:hypothetical protein [Alkalihalobacillus alcalophilus]KGA95816.1 multi-TM2 domain-containing protein [Alkalihalobacillus alcalophilus ATCC 27647 = CGMCC 1.3604]MED1563690.1 hypothetical protein [Alkalihalobacillus alcalophilus]THG90487.1 hypothetical protein AJ85_10475 [Alkalihalobacillus alcalophilus ATCC 27647 = CGMCC 1.3604]
MNRNNLVAFFLAFIPGGSFFYLRRPIMALIYVMPFTILFSFGIIMVFDLGYIAGEALIAFFLAMCVWFVQFIHSVINVLRNQSYEPTEGEVQQKTDDSERLFITFMSLIPGLGHMQLGLMNRGLTLMVAFFGLITMVIFTTVLTGQGVFIVFLGLLPIIWIFNLFDVIQFVNKKGKGEELVDRSILEDIEANRIGRKSKPIAMLFAIFPGAGHLYLGLQRRGLQLMALFLIGLFLMDLLRLTMFLFLIPIIWFYSFFDALQKVAQYDENLKDVPIFTAFQNYQKWIGIGAILLGGYYLFDQVLIHALAPTFEQHFGMDLRFWFYNYFQTFIVCTLLIAAGVYLLSGSKKQEKKDREGESEI